MSSIAQIEHYINQNLKEYKYNNLAKNNILRAVKTYTSLRPTMEEHTSNDGTCENLLCLDGTIPVTYRNATYNIPINIFVMKTFPYAAPLVYVRPTSNMSIKTNQHVDDNGKINLPYINSWKHPDSDLLGLISVLIDVFGEQPPVYARPSTHVNMPPLPRGNFMPPPLPNMNMPPTQSTVGSYWNLNTYPVNSGYPPAPAMPGPSIQSAWQTPTSSVAPYPVPTPNGSVPKTSSPSGTIDAEFLEVSERSALSDKLRRVHLELHSQYQSELQSLIATQEDLKKGQARLSQIVLEIDGEHQSLQKALDELTDKNEELNIVLNKLETTKDEPVNIDGMVTPIAPLYRQLTSSFAEEQSIEDTLYSLGQALGKHVIDTDTFLKSVRELSRRQFVLRETVKRCRLKASLPVN